MRAWILALPVASLLVMSTGANEAALTYPLSVTLDASVKSGVTTITSKVTIQVTRQMSDPTRTRANDSLKFSGFPGFVNALRPLVSVGSIETQSNSVPIRYTREEQDGAATRLLLIADRPVFFLGPDPTKSRAGFELTVVELRFDGQGGVTGQMAGAAKVRPSSGGVELEDYAEALVALTGRVGPS